MRKTLNWGKPVSEAESRKITPINPIGSAKSIPVTEEPAGSFSAGFPEKTGKQVPKGVLIGTKDDASGFEAFQQAQTGTNPADSDFEGKLPTSSADLNADPLQGCVFEKRFHTSGNTEITIPISNYLVIQSNGMMKKYDSGPDKDPSGLL